MSYNEEEFKRLFVEYATGSARLSIDYWAEYFALEKRNLTHDSAPFEISFTVDVRELKRRAGAP